MPKQFEIYKCNHCGTIVEVLHEGGAPLNCCGEAMAHIVAGTTDAATEKHVPVIEKTANGYKVTVGSVEHPSTDAHWIEWIELIADGKSYKEFITPGAAPVAEFCIEAAGTVVAREYCNLHGLWEAKA